MAVKNGDFVRVEFTGKIKETGDVFDATNEEVAMEANILDEKRDYGPVPIIVGANHILKPLDEAIVGMEEGNSKKVDISPEEGFGERNKDLIQLMPMKEFKKQGIKPYVGMGVTLEGHKGKVMTISGGRVKVDFNSELAGKNLEYDIILTEIIEDLNEKIKAMVRLHYPYPNMDLDKTIIEIDDKNLRISLDEATRADQRSYLDVSVIKYRIANEILENMDFEKVEFVDIYEKPEIKKEDSSENLANTDSSKDLVNEGSSENLVDEGSSKDLVDEGSSEDLANDD